MALGSFKGGIPRSIKLMLIFLLVTVLGFVVYNLYIFPLLMSSIKQVYIDPMEFRMRSFQFDEFLEEEVKDFVYRDIPPNPFMPILEEKEVVPTFIFDPEKRYIEYLLKGVVSQNGRRLAIIEGDYSSFILEEGDRFQDLMVIAISREQVLVRDEEQAVYTLVLGGGYGETQ